MTEFEEKHQYSKGYRKVDWTKGEYLNFSQLINAEWASKILMLWLAA